MLAFIIIVTKGILSGLRQFFAAENSLNMMKNVFCFTSKDLFILKIFNILSLSFGHVAKQLDKKDEVNFKFYDVRTCLTNNPNTILPNFSRSTGNQAMKFG